MTTAKAPLPYLERRPGGFLYRRRVPGRLAPVRPVAETGAGPLCAPSENKLSAAFLRLSLRTHVPCEARILAMRLTAFFDLAFALATERHMDHLRPDQIEMLEALARFQIAAHAAARAAAPARSEAAARQVAACEQATQAVLRRALATGDRELARQPLREVAVRLGLAQVEDTEDWNRLAYEATRVLLDASQTREREELGEFDAPSPVFRSARARMDGAMDGAAQTRGTSWALPAAPAWRAPSPVALPIPQAIQMARPAPEGPPLAPVAQPADTGPAGDPAPSQENPAPNAIRTPVPASGAAGSDPARDALARHLQMRPPMLENLPLEHLSPGLRQVLRDKPRGITLTEAIQLFEELKTLGYGNEFDKHQTGDPIAGQNWVRDSRSKTRFATQFWPEFVGDGPLIVLVIIRLTTDDDQDLADAHFDLAAMVPRTTANPRCDRK